MSSTDPRFNPAARSYDGNEVSFFVHTRREKAPWVELDLGEPTRFSTVILGNRSDCCGERAVPLVVEVGDAPGIVRTVARRDDPFGTVALHFPEVQARYLRIRATGTTVLHLERVAIR